jgi:hypothetical protein
MPGLGSLFGIARQRRLVAEASRASADTEVVFMIILATLSLVSSMFSGN